MSFSTQEFIVQKITTTDEKRSIVNYCYNGHGKLIKRTDTEKLEYPTLSNSHEIAKDFVKLIKDDKYRHYFALLDEVYICKVLKFLQKEEKNSVTTYAVCRVRPMLEAIYFYNTPAFLQLINALIEKNDESFYNAFVEAVRHNSSLDVDELFTCTAGSKFEAYEIIRDVKEFSADLKDTILKNVTQLEVNAKDNKTLFNNLRLKLEILELLKKHVSAPIRMQDNSLKCTVVNVLTILFLAAIPNVIQFIATCGNDFLFFNKKTPRNLVDTMGIRSSMLPQQFKLSP